jgi:hypothetical protein
LTFTTVAAIQEGGFNLPLPKQQQNVFSGFGEGKENVYFI